MTENTHLNKETEEWVECRKHTWRDTSGEVTLRWRLGWREGASHGCVGMEEMNCPHKAQEVGAARSIRGAEVTMMELEPGRWQGQGRQGPLPGVREEDNFTASGKGLSAGGGMI